VVPVVDLLAGGARDASSWAGVSVTTAIEILVKFNGEGLKDQRTIDPTWQQFRWLVAKLVERLVEK
jgi:hypothetical protein